MEQNECGTNSTNIVGILNRNLCVWIGMVDGTKTM